MTSTDRSRRRSALLAAGCAVLAVLAALVAPAPAQARAARGAADLTGDGVPDVVVSAGGAVVVLGRNGSVARVLRPPQSTGGSGASYAIATGDFDGDGRADLAVGDSSFATSGVFSAGAVFVYRGGAAGVADPPTVITENDLGSLDAVESSDQFGRSLAAADIDKDGYTDLVVAAGADWVDGVRWAGEVFVLRGGPAGPATGSAVKISQNTPGVPGTSETNDGFGGPMAFGDVTGDGYPDLALSASQEFLPVGGVQGFHGVLYLFPGGPGGLSTQPLSYVTGLASEIQLGRSLVVADVTGDGHADVLTASEGNYDSRGCGTLTLFKGGTSGIGATRTRWTQDSAGVPGACVQDFSWDGWGMGLAADDLDGDGFADVVLGDRGETVSGQAAGGSYTILFGRSTGLTTTGAVRVTQDTANVAGVAEDQDYFGSAVAIHDLDGNGRLDLVVSTEQEAVGGVVRGAVHGLVSGTTFRPAASSWSLTGASASLGSPLRAFGLVLG